MHLGVDPARFIPRLILALVLCLPLWIVLVPMYNQILATGLTVTLPLVGEGGRTATVWKDFIVVPFPRSEERKGRPEVEGFRGYLAHYNTPLLVALILATPGLRLHARLKATGLGVLALYPLQLVYMILVIKLYPYTRAGGEGVGSGWGYRWGAELYLTIVAQLTPIVLWFLFLRYHWQRQPAASREPLSEKKTRKRAIR